MKFSGLLIFLFLTEILFAQSARITGLVTDSTDRKSIENASIILYSTKDSSLKAFTRVNNKGIFELIKPDNGQYILTIYHPDYGEVLDTVVVTENMSSFTPYVLFPKRILYEQVIIKAKISPIRIKGDTIVYTADSFKVRDGANVEELLRKLPGIQVGRNGEIVALGEKVKKVLVDGEEFFGDDPGIAIKNLKADAIDEVEVYDKKSDQATFTGIDDGVKDKTINLKLKASKKNGYFGKVEAGGGSPDNYSNQAMINGFKKKRKIAAFGIMSNVGSLNLGWNDRETYGDNDGIESGMSESGGMWSSASGDEFNSFWGGANGIPKNWNGGLHYSNKFNNDKQSVNIGYKYNKVNAIANSNSFSKTFLPDSTWENTGNSNIFTSRDRNSLNGSFETLLDSLNSIKVVLKGTEQDNFINSRINNAAFTDDPINSNERTVTNRNKKKTMNGSILWMHKFKKKSRTLSINFGTTLLENNANGNLFSINTFYKSGLLVLRDTIDQNKLTNIENRNFSGRISYTEPLSKLIVTEISYGLGINKNNQERISLDKDPTGKYTVMVPLFSNNFQFNTTVHTPGLSFKYTKKKLNASIGTKVGINQFEQTNLSNNVKQDYNFTNIFPSASANFKMKGNKNLSLNYNGSGTAPNLNQLQPIQDNTNPFFIVVGNPDLRQSFQHDFNASFNMWNVMTEKSIWSYFNFSTEKNAYANFSVIDTFGKTISKTVNVNGNYNIDFNINHGFKIKKLKTNVDIGPQFRFSNQNDFINGLLNNSKTYSYGTRIQLNKWIENKWGFWMGHNFDQNINKSTVSNISSANFWSITGNSSIWWPITKKYNLVSEINYEVRQKDPRFPLNNNYMTVNLSLSKKIWKDAFTLQIEIKDLFNQNRGYFRNFSSYNFTESYFNTLRRFWLFSITYNFNSQKTKK